MKIPQQQMLNPASLHAAPWNPPNRLLKQRLKPLMNSLDDIGQCQAILITPDRMIVEGHRRWACSKALKWKGIRCETISDEQAENVKRIYAGVNGTLAKHSGNDKLGIWLQDPEAVQKVAATRFSHIETIIGRDLMRRMYRAGVSMKVFQCAKQICGDTGRETPERIKEVIEWLLKYRCVGQVMKGIQAGNSPKIIMNAVRADKPVRFRLSVG